MLKKKLEQAVYSAIAYYIDGAVSITKLFERLGFTVSYTLNGATAHGLHNQQSNVLTGQKNGERQLEL